MTIHLTKYLETYNLPTDSVLLINTLSGALDLIDTHTYSALRKATGGRDISTTPLSKVDIARLKNRGYLFHDIANEESTAHRILASFRQVIAASPLVVDICLSLGCNFQCSYCYERSVIDPECRVMSLSELAQAFEAVDSLAVLHEKKDVHIGLFGGEPLLPDSRQQVAAILDMAETKKWKVYIISNGFTLCEYAELFAKYSFLIQYVQVTIDGPPEVHDSRRRHIKSKGSFHRIMEGVRRCVDHNVRCIIRTNVDAENVDDLPEFARILISEWSGAHAPEFSLAPVTDYRCQQLSNHILPESTLVAKIMQLRRKHTEMSVFRLGLFRVVAHILNVIEFDDTQLTLPRFMFCQADSMAYYAFTPEGYVYCCPEAVGMHQYSVGKYLPELELNETSLQPWRNRSILTNTKCRDCSVAPLCGGGCTLAAFEAARSGRGVTCPNVRETLQAFLHEERDTIVAKYFNENRAGNNQRKEASND